MVLRRVGRIHRIEQALTLHGTRPDAYFPTAGDLNHAMRVIAKCLSPARALIVPGTNEHAALHAHDPNTDEAMGLRPRTDAEDHALIQGCDDRLGQAATRGHRILLTLRECPTSA